jgi:N-acyl-D-aspartate/D-glutamate deacylase
MSVAIRGGTVVDGTGSPARRADVLVTDGLIAAVGEDAIAGVTLDDTIDAAGMVVAPGFIDLHTHYDAQVFWDPTLSSSCWHGVTTLIGGNCGFSLAPAAPEHRELLVGMLSDLEDMSPETLRAGISWEFQTFSEYLDAVDRRRPYLNWAGYVGHSAIRIAVMGADAYGHEADQEQIDKMAWLADEAMAAGAIGVATSAAPGGRNTPTRYARRDEVVAVVGAVARAGRGVAAFVPGGDIDVAALYELQLEIGRPFTWTALLTNDDGLHRERAALHRLGMRAGADVHPQVSCRKLVGQATLANGFALRCPAMIELDRASLDQRMAAYADRAWRQRVSAQLATRMFATWDRWVVAECARRPELVGQVVSEAAGQAGVDPLDFVLDLSLTETLRTRFDVIMANRDEKEIPGLLTLEGAILGLSDAGAHPDQLCDAVMPTDLLGGWVRERGALSLEHAVRKLSGEQADFLGLPGRGYVLPGMHADLVVFDPKTIGPGPFRRVRDFPADGERLIADSPTGIGHILVNGVAITRDGRSLAGQLEEGPGQVLRSSTA